MGGLYISEIIFILVLLASNLFWIWMLVDCIAYDKSTGGEKTAWILLIAFTHIIGSVIYFFAKRVKRTTAW